MRSAGCIFNDIVDKDYDKKVKEQKKANCFWKISVKKSLIYVLLCAVAFLVLIQFNLLTIILGLGSMLLAFSYPFMKRITYGLNFLGVTFNWGFIMAWASITNIVNYEIFILYLSAIFWTLSYDTIYGAQDIRWWNYQLKSTVIKFKKNIKLFIFFFYFMSILLTIYFFKNYIGINAFTCYYFYLSLLNISGNKIW